MSRWKIVEEWLRQPERQTETFPGDPTRSPYEGDIPPWGQAQYAGYFPLEGKVFYVVAYVGDTPLPPGPVQESITMRATPIRDVGTAPAGLIFGSHYMFHPVAAVPVRKEDLKETGPLIDYLVRLIGSTDLFGKIVLMDSFPQADVIELMGGPWFPVRKDPREWPGFMFANAYSTNRLYGGPEEGGWWYDAGLPVGSVPYPQEDEEAKNRWLEYLKQTAGWFSGHDTGSVLGHDVFDYGAEDHFATPFPSEPPHYE